jgi:hypothetical protein
MDETKIFLVSTEELTTEQIEILQDPSALELAICNLPKDCLGRIEILAMDFWVEEEYSGYIHTTLLACPWCTHPMYLGRAVGSTFDQWWRTLQILGFPMNRFEKGQF